MSRDHIENQHRRTRLLAAEIEAGTKHIRMIRGGKRRSTIVFSSEAECRELEAAVKATESGDRKGRILPPGQ